MHYIISGRQGGKTYRLLEWLAAAPEDVSRIVIVPTFERKKLILDQYREKFNLEDWNVITVGEARGGTASVTHRRAQAKNIRVEYAFDDLNDTLHLLFPNLVIFGATSGGINHEPRNYPLTS